MPKAAIELAREKRVRAAVKRLEAKIDTAHAELAPQIEAAPAGNGLVFAAPQRSAELLHVERVDLPADAAQATSAGRPAFFASSADRYEWLMQHRSTWGEGDAQWLADYAASHDYEALAGYFSSRGIAWAADGHSPDIPGFNQAG
jgi:putative transposase